MTLLSFIQGKNSPWTGGVPCLTISGGSSRGIWGQGRVLYGIRRGNVETWQQAGLEVRGFPHKSSRSCFLGKVGQLQLSWTIGIGVCEVSLTVRCFPYVWADLGLDL